MANSNLVIEYIEENHPEEYENIAQAGAMLKSALHSALPVLKQDLAAVVTREDFDAVEKLNDACKELISMEASLPEWLQSISYISEGDQPLVLDLEEDETSEPVDYSLYEVDRTSPHAMDEDFTNTKICAFDFNGSTIEVDSWQDALVKLSASLAEISSEKLYSFVGNEEFQGSRVSYFVTKPTERKTKSIPGTDIYVWVNLSAVQIVRLMKKMLKAYKLDDIVIYLRADYSELHWSEKSYFTEKG